MVKVFVKALPARGVFDRVEGLFLALWLPLKSNEY